MTKYTDNEQYETDKADWLYHLEIHVNEGLNLDALDVVDIFNLLKQSKWIGVDKEIDNNNWAIFTTRLDAENYTNKLIAEGANDVALQRFSARLHTDSGIVYNVTYRVCKNYKGDRKKWLNTLTMSNMRRTKI